VLVSPSSVESAGPSLLPPSLLLPPSMPPLVSTPSLGSAVGLGGSSEPPPVLLPPLVLPELPPPSSLGGSPHATSEPLLTAMSAHARSQSIVMLAPPRALVAHAERTTGRAHGGS
jgi:hypothetical protein